MSELALTKVGMRALVELSLSGLMALEIPKNYTSPPIRAIY
jgi:hypothetical protein